MGEDVLAFVRVFEDGKGLEGGRKNGQPLQSLYTPTQPASPYPSPSSTTFPPQPTQANTPDTHSTLATRHMVSQTARISIDTRPQRHLLAPQ